MAQPESLPQSFWDGYYRETVAKIAAQRERSSWWQGNAIDLGVPVLLPAIAVLAVGLPSAGRVMPSSSDCEIFPKI
jgi:hypothetical protein